MERIDRIVVGRDEIIGSDDEIHLLLPRRMTIFHRREVQDDICIAALEFHTRLGGGKKKFFRDQRRDVELAGNGAHFFVSRRFKIDPLQFPVGTAP